MIFKEQFVFLHEFAICYQCQNVEESEIKVCARLLGLCTTWVLAKGILLALECQCAVATSDSKMLWAAKFVGSWQCAALVFASTEVMHRPRLHSPLHFDIRKIVYYNTLYRRIVILKTLHYSIWGL